MRDDTMTPWSDTGAEAHVYDPLDLPSAAAAQEPEPAPWNMKALLAAVLSVSVCIWLGLFAGNSPDPAVRRSYPCCRPGECRQGHQMPNDCAVQLVKEV